MEAFAYHRNREPCVLPPLRPSPSPLCPKQSPGDRRPGQQQLGHRNDQPPPSPAPLAFPFCRSRSPRSALQASQLSWGRVTPPSLISLFSSKDHCLSEWKLGVEDVCTWLKAQGVKCQILASSFCLHSFLTSFSGGFFVCLFWGLFCFVFFVVLFVCFFLFSFLRCSQEFRKGEWHTSRSEIGILYIDFCRVFFGLFFIVNMSYPQSIIYKV